MFWPNLSFEHTRPQTRRTGLKSSPNCEKCAISLKRAQNARSGPCGANFDKISLLSIPDLQILVLASNHRRIVKTVRFLWKAHETSFAAVRSKFWQNLIFEYTRPQNRRFRLKSTPNSENSMKIAQNARLGRWGACFGQILFLSTPDLKLVVLDLK